MRLIFTCLTALALGTPALAEPVIVLGDTPYKTFGKRVSVSSVVRLATITGDRPRMSATRAYLPAGKILLVGRGGLCHKKSLDLWCFAVTQDGLPVFVRADSKGYFKADAYDGFIAVAQRPGSVATTNGRVLEYSSSERYQVVDFSDDTVTLAVGPENQKPGFDAATTVEIPREDSDFVFVDTDELRSATSYAPIRPRSRGDALARLSQDIADLDIDAQSFREARDFFERLLVEEKNCSDEITLERTADAELAVEVGGMLSAIDAKFQITASYSKSTSYPKGMQMRALRYVQDLPGEGSRFFEIWERLSYEDESCKGVIAARLTGSDDAERGGESGEITTQSARDMGLGVSESRKFPSYSCDREYFTALDHLTSADGRLSQAAAELLVTYAMRYQSAGGIKSCCNLGGTG
ncbi:hypothetical protein OEZ49_08430 [Ruegeria sp. WL0004]|uniref:Uncharacterized protein n=1 Tax=Ruegeria marisflavi TaxID=2984152 RepID=A0ABT2WS09_9RHOB|nr:hypothetical protein [Ruegeria sp. WL0004]MCU9837790.1 hypothetical protein [Ruegeria sp. WL0004]